jgi:23S rRNA (cytidine1920-2'-O)/16S rRNA (cytidine1409-2'-O)-methyltransferase
MARPKLVPLQRAVARAHPALADPAAAIRDGRVTLDGAAMTNPATLVAATARPLLDDSPAPLRGTLKLAPALERFDLRLPAAVVLDAGAAAGGFTTALLDGGAARVYAVDVGFGQLVGRLRQDPRVVVLERTNVADLDDALVPEPLDVITLDLSYLAIADALPQLERLRLAPGARLLALVKPMFELHLGHAPGEEEPELLGRALTAAREGAERAGWTVEDAIDSPLPGSRGARELFLFATRS